MKDKNKRNHIRLLWFSKTFFMLFPLFFLFNAYYFLTILISTALISYLGLVLRNRKPLLSIIALPFLYIKTFLVTYNILKFWEK